MDDMNAFERQVAGEILLDVGPERPLDAMAVVRSVKEHAPRSRFQAMFGATKFVVAGAVVALFGGFLLAGVLTTRPIDEAVPAGLFPSPATTEELLSYMVTEEVAPGVFRVLSDGVRELTSKIEGVSGFDRFAIVAGLDGSVWRVGGDEFTRLGDGTERAWPGRTAPYARDEEFMVGVDGVVWRSIPYSRPNSFGPSYSLWSFEGEEWAQWQRDESPSVFRAFTHVDGSTYVSTGTGVSRLDDSVESLVSLLADRGEQPRGGSGWDLVVTNDGARWLMAEDGLAFLRDTGDGWETIDMTGLLERIPSDAPIEHPRGIRTDVSADGVLWASVIPVDASDGQPVDPGWLARLDGSGWGVWDASDGLPDLYRGDFLNRVHAAPDGSVWAQPRHPNGKTQCPGLANFDGTTWTHYLDGLCVIDYDVALDGAVWIHAASSTDIARDPVSTYVITPEAPVADA